MIIALFALALAMIVGGLLTAFFGWDIVLIERGWTMVIAGTFSAASGALLLGIAAAIRKLGQIHEALARLQTLPSGQGVSAATAATAGLSLAALAGGLENEEEAERRDEDQATLPLFADEDRSEGGIADREPAERPAPTEPRAFPTRRPFETERSEEQASLEARVPGFLLAERTRETEVEVRVENADDSLYETEPAARESESQVEAGEEDRAEEVTPAAWPEASDTPEAPADEAEEAEADLEEASSATVIGTYNSGDNRYVMFSDGSIEAETPRGNFRFRSLDELKEFIASGGESGSSAA
ncbi:hypothetical protein [Microvirga roseola]|uniref:hypothetical protein n=1 Tax=Microvirga roseola TaxID=2883126 RepID=UPI001E562B76|nr:hypothetical protein [Microvirga roseola]